MTEPPYDPDAPENIAAAQRDVPAGVGDDHLPTDEAGNVVDFEPEVYADDQTVDGPPLHGDDGTNPGDEDPDEGEPDGLA